MRSIRNSTARIILGILPLVVACPALATFKLDPVNARRDLILVLVAGLVALAFLSVRRPSKVRIRPVGRRVADLPNTSDSFADSGLTPAFWRVVRIERWCVETRFPLWIWKITLQRVSLVGLDRMRRLTRLPLFHFAESPEESESHIAPIVRKIFQRYRHEFEHRSPIAITQTQAATTTMTWIQHEAAIRSAVFGFLDECIEIAKVCNSRPSLEITRGPVFVVTVSWQHFEGAEELLSRAVDHPALEMLPLQGGFALRLWVSFERTSIPESFEHIASPQQVSAEERYSA